MSIKVKAIETNLSHFSDKNGNSLGYQRQGFSFEGL